MKVLVVMAECPFPPHVGSAIVAYNSMKHLSKSHDVDLISFYSDKSTIPNAQFVRNSDFVYQNKASLFIGLTKYLRSIVLGVPFLFDYFSANTIKQKIKTAIEQQKYDAVVLFEMSTIQFCPPQIYEKLIINIEDPLAIKLYRLARLPIWGFFKRTKLLLKANIIDNYERNQLPKLAKVLLLSSADLNDMFKHADYKNLAYMPYGVETKPQSETNGYESREKAIIFSGNMYHPPNVDALLFFLKAIFPLILRENDSVTFWIVGNKPDTRIYKLAKEFGARVLITGSVDNISDYIKRALVSICPVRLKIGVQTKILEAMSLGTPVVTTSEGNSGIGAESGLHLWVEDEPILFARKVISLLNGDNWDKFSNEGVKMISERFSWEKSVELLEKQIELVTASN